VRLAVLGSFNATAWICGSSPALIVAANDHPGSARIWMRWFSLYGAPAMVPILPCLAPGCWVSRVGDEWIGGWFRLVLFAWCCAAQRP
jgi:hypothetical protein